MISPSKLDIVRKHLQDELASGKYIAGSAFLSENELSRHLGICKNTVREAMSGLVAEGILIRKRGLGTFVCEPPAVLSAVRESKVLHLLVGEFTGEQNPFVGSLLTGLHAELDKHDYRILVHCIPDADKGANQLKHLPAGNCAAIILAGFDFSRELIEAIHKSGISAVTIGRPEPELRLLPYVHTDHRTGMKKAVKYLLNRGHKRIALVDSPGFHAESYFERQEGFFDAMNEAAITPDARLVVSTRGNGPANAIESCRILLARKVEFSAVIVYGVSESYAFLREFEKTGRKIPDDLSLLTYASRSSLLSEFFTSGTWSLTALARAAARTILGTPGPDAEYPLDVFISEGLTVSPRQHMIQA